MPEPPSASAARVVTTAAATSALAPLASTFVVVALPEMLLGLDASLAWGAWVVIAYLVAMAAVQPVAGAAGDRFGRERVLAAGLAGFVAASLVAAVAPNVIVLILARVGQALTGGAAIPNGVALVRARLPAAAQGRALGTIAILVGVAAAGGPPLGGAVAELVGWRWVFLVLALVAAPAWWAALRLPREPSPEGRNASERPTFDAAGAGLLFVALLVGTASITAWRLPGVHAAVPLGCAVAALVLGAALLRRVRHGPAPILDLSLLRTPAYSAACGAVAASNQVMYTVFLAIPLQADRIHGLGASAVGGIVAGMSLMMAVLGPVGGRWADARGDRAPAVVGSALATAGVATLALLPSAAPQVARIAALALLGSGVGLSSAPIHAAAMRAAPPERSGRAAGLFSTVRYMGGIAGAALLTLIVGDEGGDGAFRATFALLILAGLAATLASRGLSGRGPRPATDAATADAPRTPRQRGRW